MKNFASASGPKGPKWAKAYLGTIRGPEPIIDGGTIKQDYSGLYTVKLDTGQIRYNIPFMPSTYSPKTNSGMIRLFSPDEPVIVVETNKGDCFIMGNALLPYTDTRAPLPIVGGFNRAMKPGEVLIGGPSIKVPKRIAYLFFDIAGGIEMRANSSSIKFSGDNGNIELTSFRYGIHTESGSEVWGAHPLLNNLIPPGTARPGHWSRLVRCKDSDNNGQFINTEEGNLGLSVTSLDTDPTSPIYFKNFNNNASVVVTKSGSYSIVAGLKGVEKASAKLPISLMSPLRRTAPLEFSLNVETGTTTVRAPIVNIYGGLTGTEGAISMRAARFNLLTTSNVNLTSQGSVAIIAKDVIINATSTKLLGDVTIVGNLKVVGAIQAVGGVSATMVTAPTMSIDRT